MGTRLLRRRASLPPPGSVAVLCPVPVPCLRPTPTCCAWPTTCAATTSETSLSQIFTICHILSCLNHQGSSRNMSHFIVAISIKCSICIFKVSYVGHHCHCLDNLQESLAWIIIQKLNIVNIAQFYNPTCSHLLSA